MVQDLYLSKEDWSKLRKYRIKRLTKQMKKDDLDALLLTEYYNVKYVTDYLLRSGGKDQIVFVLQDGEYELLMNPLWILETKKYCPWIKRIRPLRLPPERLDLTEPLRDIHKTVEDLELQKSRIGIDFLSYPFVDSLRAKFPGMELLDATKLVNVARSIKSPEELAVMKEAARIADVGMEAALKSVKEGEKEYEVARSCESAIWAEGAFPYSSYVSSGPKTAICAENILNRRIKKGDLVIIDIGCILSGYIAEFTRTTIVGKAKNQQKKLYQTVFRAHREAIKTLRPGASTVHVSNVASTTVKKAGFELNFEPDLMCPSKGWIGHGIGISFHEWPEISSAQDVKLREGMVICVELQIFTRNPKVGGVRLEDVVAFRENKPYVLTKTEYCADLL